MMKMQWPAGVLAASLLAAGAANAASYNFNVLYSGGGVGVQQAGDDILGTTMLAGDDFTYTLSADGDGAWKSLTGAGVFPLIALPTNESGNRDVDYTLDLFNDGLSVYSVGESGIRVAEVHVGTNTQSILAGLVFDQWVLRVSILSAHPLDDDMADQTTTPSSILPIFGPADVNEPTIVAYSATGFGATAVPEPTTWALMIAGFGLIGGALRQRSPTTRRAT